MVELLGDFASEQASPLTINMPNMQLKLDYNIAFDKYYISQNFYEKPFYETPFIGKIEINNYYSNEPSSEHLFTAAKPLGNIAVLLLN